MGYHHIDFGRNGYDFFWDADASTTLAEVAARLDADRFLVITDEIVLRFHGDRLLKPLMAHQRTTILLVERGESGKNFATLAHLCEQAVHSGITRRSVVVALGGGAVGNVAGMVAGLLFRGIRLLHVPTTLIAAFDSAISMKQAINASTGKNVIGLYHRPEAVVVDLPSLATLEERDFRSGICETIKNVVAVAPDTFQSVADVIRPDRRRTMEALKRILMLSLEAKCRVMSHDPMESREAIVLEYGHTIGHAIELADMRTRGSEGCRHGDAVAVGMRLAALIAQRMGVASPEVTELQNALFEAARVEPVMPTALGAADVLQLVMKDNKRGRLPCGEDDILMILLAEPSRPCRTGDIPLIAVPRTVVAGAIGEAAGWLGKP